MSQGLPSLARRPPNRAGNSDLAPPFKARYVQWLDVISLAVGVVFLLILAQLPLPPRLGSLLLDAKEGHVPILSVHTFIWLIFFVGLGRLLLRLREAHAEERELQQEYLPAGDDIILTSEDLGALYQKLRSVSKRRLMRSKASVGIPCASCASVTLGCTQSGSTNTFPGEQTGSGTLSSRRSLNP